MDSKKISQSLNVEMNIPFSDKIEDPSVIAPFGFIKMIFSEDIDFNTVSTGIKIYKVKSDGKEEEMDVIINIDEKSSNVLYINKSEEKISEGEEYKL
ncbi:MAG: metallophosphoesterase, partial [Methanobacterium sp.]